MRVVRCGVVWRGVVWCGVVWCGVVWCGIGYGWCDSNRFIGMGLDVVGEMR